MKILMTGSTGFIGSALLPSLTAKGHQVTRLIRSEALKSAETRPSITWDPDQQSINPLSLEGFDAVIHLAGESIAGGRWTAQRKARIRESRSKGTHLLSDALGRLAHPPKIFISASAIGYYGSRGKEKLNEKSTPGADFLATVCQEWEQATIVASNAGIQVVNPRIGMVLSPRGGALAKLLTPFRLGVGGVVGDGSQYMSWITLDDLLGVFHHTLSSDQLRGPVNAVSPKPVTNREFTKILGRVLGRPTVFPLPAFVAKLAFGEMAEALLLSSQRVEPQRLLETNYTFRFPDLEQALSALLGK
jgi:uncharacterized protein (TIGR01777 family)